MGDSSKTAPVLESHSGKPSETKASKSTNKPILLNRSLEDHQIRKGELGLDYLFSRRKKFEYWEKKRQTMAVPWGVTLWMARMVWLAVTGWITSCLTVADEIASSLRTGDVGPFHVG